MYKATKFKKLQVAQDKTFAAIRQFIDYYNTKDNGAESGYLFFDESEKSDDRITVKVGADRFTIHSRINIKQDTVFFTVYAHIFDINERTKYRYELVQSLGFKFDGDNTIRLDKERIRETRTLDKKIVSKLLSFNVPDSYTDMEALFEAMEEYTDNRLSGNDGKMFGV